MGRVFQQAEIYLDQLDPDSVGVFVEIGTSRQGDDGSTAVLSRWANRFDRPFYSIDIDPENCDFARDRSTGNTQIINASGQEWLAKNQDGISLLYLDNFDWDWHPDRTEDFVIEQQKRYKDLGLDMNNLNSQRAHLEQAELAVNHMTVTSLIICDDTWYNRWWGHFSGKSGAVVPFLMNYGFEILYTEEQPVYGTILGRNMVKKH